MKRDVHALPKRVLLEVTARCDLRCVHCAGAMRARARGDMDYAFFLRISSVLRRLGVPEIGLGLLGEPFLCRWLPEAVYHAKRQLGFPFVFVATNGRLATPERVRECIDAGLDRLELSYNYSGPEQFHYVTGAREQDFWKVDVNLMAARLVRDEVKGRTGHECRLVATSVRFDEQQAKRMARALKRVRASADAHCWRPLRGPFGAVRKRDGARGPCTPLYEQAHITYDGRLSACPYDHDRRFEMGDLNAETFLEAWDGARFVALRSAHLSGELAGTACEHCTGWQ